MRTVSRARRAVAPKSGLALVAAVTLALTGAGVWTATTAQAATPDTIWGSSAPAQAAVDSDTGSVELGTTFTATTAGQAIAVRFYKTKQNRGTHTGSLWTNTGTLLGKVTFTSETSSGWQLATFPKPINLTAGSTYVVSYHAPYGRYLSTPRYSGTSASPNLTIPTSNVGVYAYGATSIFPANSWRSSNYWVDLAFTPGTTSTGSTAPATSSTTPTSTSSATAPSTSATPTATTSTTPPALCGTSAVWSNLAACGWAGPGNTGYPAGEVFSKTVTGGLTVTADNTVIDGYRISGGVMVDAKNVTIRNSWITNSAGGVSGTGVVKVLNGASATIDHNLLDGLNATHTCIWHEGASMVATANECTEVNDGIFSWATTLGVDGTGDNFTIADNWLHNFTTAAANGHVDGYQTEGAKNGVIRHNTFDVAFDQTSAVAIWDSRKDAANIAVSNNLIQGGGFSIYAEDYSPSETSPGGGYSVTNVTFTNNRFSNSLYACVGYWGVWYTRGSPTDGWHRSGNVLLETGQNLDSNNPVVNGWECR